MKEYKYKINGNNYTVAVGDIDENVAQVEVNGVPYKVVLDTPKTITKVASVKAAAAPRTASGEKIISSKPVSGGVNNIVAPLPSTVISVAVKPADVVKASDTVVMLEAMKMEKSIRAGGDG